MEIIEFFNRDDNKYTDLFVNILTDSSLLIDDLEKQEQLEKNIITIINTKLEHANTHCQGLNLLCNYCSKFSKENLTKHSLRWISKVIQILSRAHNNSQELVVSCKTAGALFTSCKQLAELDKKIFFRNVKEIIVIIVDKYNEEKNLALLHLLNTLIFHYPESCVHFQALLSKTISSCVDDENTQIALFGAKCYALLVRAIQHSSIHTTKDNIQILTGNKNASYYASHQVNLCNNLSIILDELFKDIVTATTELPCDFQHHTVNILQLSEISCHDILEYYVNMETRFSNLCTYLSTLIRAGHEKGKLFLLPNVILQVICKGLGITQQNLKKQNQSSKDILLFILPKLHISLLNILGTVTESFQQELVPFAVAILRLLLQTLDWTQELCNTSYRDVRKCTYKTLSVFLKQMGSLSDFGFLADEYLPHLIKDLSTSNKSVITLSTNKQKSNSKSKKSKENQNIKDYDCNTDLNTSDRMDPELFSETLLAVQSILFSSNNFVKSSFYDKIKNTVVLILYEIYVNKNFNVISADPACRLQLLRTLRVLQTYHHHSTPSPTSYAIQIYNIALSQDQDPKINEEVSFGLAELHHVINPAAPTLMLPMSERMTPHSSFRLSSPQLLQHMEITHSSQSENNVQTLEEPSDQSIQPIKRPRLEENLQINSSKEVIETTTENNCNSENIEKCTEETVENVENNCNSENIKKSTEESVENIDDDEMIDSFNDVPLS